MLEEFSQFKRITRHTNNKKASATCSIFVTTFFECFTIYFERSDLSAIGKKRRGKKSHLCVRCYAQNLLDVNASKKNTWPLTVAITHLIISLVCDY